MHSMILDHFVCPQDSDHHSIFLKLYMYPQTYMCTHKGQTFFFGYLLGVSHPRRFHMDYLMYPHHS